MQDIHVRKSTLLLTGIAVLGIFGFAKAQTPQDSAGDASCLSNLKQISLGTLMYVQDYDEHFPPMTSSSGTQKVLMPYTKNMQIFVCPVTKLPYKPNAALSKKTMVSVKSPASTVLFSDAKPHPDGMMGIAYTDGHAKLVKASAKGGKPKGKTAQ